MDVSKNVNSYAEVKDDNSKYLNVGTGAKEVDVLGISKNDGPTEVNIFFREIPDIYIQSADVTAQLYISIIYQSTNGTELIDVQYFGQEINSHGHVGNIHLSFRKNFQYEGFLSIRMSVGNNKHTAGDAVYVRGYKFEKLTL